MRNAGEILLQQLGCPDDPVLRTDECAKVGGTAAHGLIGDQEADAYRQFLGGELAAWNRLRADAEGMNASPPEWLVGHERNQQRRDAGTQACGGRAGAAVVDYTRRLRKKPGVWYRRGRIQAVRHGHGHEAFPAGKEARQNNLSNCLSCELCSSV